MLSNTKSPTWYSSIFPLSLSTCCFISSCVFYSATFAFSCTFFIFSTNFFAPSYFPFFLILNPIHGSCPLFALKGDVRNGHPSNSGRRIPTLSQSRQRELVRVPAGFEYTTYTYSTWSVHYLPMVIM